MNQQSSDGDTALTAAKKGHAAVTRILLTSGTAVDQSGRQRCTADVSGSPCNSQHPQMLATHADSSVQGNMHTPLIHHHPHCTSSCSCPLMSATCAQVLLEHTSSYCMASTEAPASATTASASISESSSCPSISRRCSGLSATAGHYAAPCHLTSHCPHWVLLSPGRPRACKRSDGRPGVMAAAAKASLRCVCSGLHATWDWQPTCAMTAEDVPDGVNCCMSFDCAREPADLPAPPACT